MTKYYIKSFWGKFYKRGVQITLALLALLFILTGAGVLWFSTLDLPDFKSFESRKIIQSTKIFDRTGKVVLYDIHDNIRRTIVPFADISRNVKNATIATEDSEFYEHHGIRPLSILRSVMVDIMAKSTKQGGSTITQQVIKKTLLTDDKSIARKVKEMILAIKMEQVMSKDDIFSLYLNEIPYGGNVYGIEEASLNFFGKHASEVTLAEAAYLTSLPQAPTFYSPYGNNRKELDARKNFVLSRMLALGYIKQPEYTAAKIEKVTFLPGSDSYIKAPHFVMYVKGILEEKYGQDMVDNGGLRVYTTLDYDLQQKAEETVTRMGPEIEKTFSAHDIGTTGVDPKTGQILLMVGSKDYFNMEDEGNFNATIAHRQPGSSFKPFVYATAFNKGYTPDTVLFDVRTQFSTACDADGKPIGSSVATDCYMPDDYDHIYRGPMSLRNALAQSVNIPAVKMLYLAGVDDSIETARSMGINGLADKARYGLTLVLGGGEISLLDLVESYSVFGNDGIRNPETAILRVEDSRGNIIDEWRPAPERVLPENTAREINDILSDNIARTPAFGASSALYIPDRPVAVKTGTTNNYRDVWITGYTPNISLGFWAGNNDNTPIDKKVAGFVIAPIWNDLMKKILPTLPVENFVKPEPVPQTIKPVLRGVWQGGQEYVVDKTSGLLATPNTPDSEKATKVVANPHSILYWVNKNDPLGPAPTNPDSDSQYHLWEPQVQKWVAEHGITTETSAVIPTEYDNVHTPAMSPVVTITSPKSDVIYSMTFSITASLITRSVYPIKQVSYFIGDALIGTANFSPFSFVFKPANVGGVTAPGKYILKAIVYDQVGNKGEANLPVEFK